ncbi:MAG: hypothetical protein CVT92_12060 [Bacteroidetes bacterium HGW-Bacteroidetes-1]|nr:MAG: hypothetical protein CVT92_12060 [Bacteroidetes bacterium HGW-Bacteroidetes-1]
MRGFFASNMCTVAQQNIFFDWGRINSIECGCSVDSDLDRPAPSTKQNKNIFQHNTNFYETIFFPKKHCLFNND